MRSSNFLTWQSIYSEVYVTPVLWPAFGVYEYYQALAAYSQRVRAFRACLAGDHRQSPADGRSPAQPHLMGLPTSHLASCRRTTRAPIAARPDDIHDGCGV